MSKRSTKRALQLVDANAAGIDLGSSSHFVSVNPDCSEESVREFGCFTCDLQAMGRWLTECGVTTVAMEATGVYWIPVYEVLSSMGLDVRLVDARKVHNVPGRKSDVQDCQWLRELQAFGLLSRCFVPDSDTLALRAYTRQRDSLVGMRATQIQMMQKALIQMNLQLHKVLTDITGVTGMQIIRAILRGERNPEALASMRRPGVKRSEDDIVKALGGTFADHHMFSLMQAVDLFDLLGEKIEQLDKALQTQLDVWCERFGKKPVPTIQGRSPRKNQPHFDLSGYLLGLTGVDLRRINGLDAHSAFGVISECGLDYSHWKTPKHWTSWLGLAPGNRISGGRRLKSLKLPASGAVAKIFRIAAQSLHHSNCALGAQLRRLAARRGMPVAIKAIARKIAIAFYQAMTKGQEYVDQGAAAYEEQQARQQFQRMQRFAKKLGYALVPETSITELQNATVS